MKRKWLITIVVLCACAGTQAADCPIEGIWKSDEAKTLESLNATGTVTDEQREVLENGFFGKVTFKIDCTEFTTLSEDSKETVCYESVEIDGDKVTVRYFDKFFGEKVQRTATMENNGECYSVPIAHLGFKEYFCKVQ